VASQEYQDDDTPAIKLCLPVVMAKIELLDAETALQKKKKGKH
jgi:hypothetical protein